jgi:hypothetical protein
VTAFLFFFNLAQWLVISFEIQKVKGLVFEDKAGTFFVQLGFSVSN